MSEWDELWVKYIQRIGFESKDNIELWAKDVKAEGDKMYDQLTTQTLELEATVIKNWEKREKLEAIKLNLLHWDNVHQRDRHAALETLEAIFDILLEAKE